MSTLLTTAEIIVLAPDVGSAKAGQELGVERYWQLAAASESSLWGECLGSGKKPYQTIVDRTNLAFNCTCPSRKFPCKHALALLLFHANEPDKFSVPEVPPHWVTTWQQKRMDSSRTREPRPAELDPSRESSRIERRTSNVSAGADELEGWLHDLIRQGLAEVPSKGYAFWNAIAARMVDAQMPGAARQLREMSGIPHSGTGWHERLLHRLALLYLLIEGFKNREFLPSNTVADIKAALGWTTGQDELAGEPGQTDRWIVVGQRTVEEERLKARRTWLIGEVSGSRALLVHHAYGSAPFDTPLTTNSVVDGELIFYPGSVRMRSFIKTPWPSAGSSDRIPHAKGIACETAAYAVAITHNPWIDQFPVVLKGVHPIISRDVAYVRDDEGNALPIAASDETRWTLLSVSGGRPIDVFGEWNGEGFCPLAATTESGLIPL